ncbi:transcription initiation factor TFIID subunit 5-like [Teleopsis dalmanni]|uniref:transcription initiation factor TFIID subunit 5-like n=1 Tax=Teleopsis dalmanni TaxID=139649 RepID=UPI0018CD72CE|nr:transcription initiation factor TFIID subunit 5-like [Teleopsis dalmanni]
MSGSNNSLEKTIEKEFVSPEEEVTNEITAEAFWIQNIEKAARQEEQSMDNGEYNLVKTCEIISKEKEKNESGIDKSSTNIAENECMPSSSQQIENKTHIAGIYKNDLLKMVYLMRKYKLSRTLQALSNELNVSVDELKFADELFIVNKAIPKFMLEDPKPLNTAYDTLLRYIDSRIPDQKKILAELIVPVFFVIFYKLMLHGYTSFATDMYKTYAKILGSDGAQLTGVECFKDLEKIEYFLNLSTFGYNMIITFPLLGQFKGHLKCNRIINLIVSKYINFNVLEVPFPEIKPHGEESIKSVNSQFLFLEVYEGCFYGAHKINSNISTSRDGSTGHRVVPMPKPGSFITTEDNQSLHQRYWHEFINRKVLSDKTFPNIRVLNIKFPKYMVNCASFSNDANVLAFGIGRDIVVIEEFENDKENPISSPEVCELGRCKKTLLRGHTATIHYIKFAPFNEYILSCGNDSTVRLWSVKRWVCLRTYSGHMGPIWQVQFAPLYKFIASCGYDRRIYMWPLNDSKNSQQILTYHTSDINSIDIHSNCNYLASASSDALVIIWNVVTGEKVRIFKGHKAAVLQIKFSTCGRYLISSGKDHETMIWDIMDAVLVAVLRLHVDDIVSINITHDNEQLILMSYDKSLSFWMFSSIIADYNKKSEPMFSQHFSLSEKCEYWPQWQKKYLIYHIKNQTNIAVSGMITYGNVFHIACMVTK